MPATTLSSSDRNASPPRSHDGARSGPALSSHTDNDRLDGHTPPRVSSLPDSADEGTTTLVQANDGAARIGAAFLTVGSDNLAAAIEANALCGRLITDMTKSSIDAVSNAAVTYAGLGRECLTCRTPADVIEFQKKAMEGITQTYVAATKLYSDLFESYSAAFEPLMARSADGPERVFRAFAD